MATKKEYPLSIVIRTVDRATAGIRAVNARLAKVAKQVEKVGKTMTTHITAPVVGLGAASAVAFTQFEKGMSNVSTLIDTNTENLDAMSKQVLAIGQRTPVALNDLTSALYDLRSAGIGATDQMAHLERSAQLGVAGLGTTKEAANIATSAINSFGLEGAEAQRVYDLVFKTVKAGKTNISELSNGFGSTAATLAASKVELDEFLAATAALTGPGLKASEAYTGLRNIVNGLTKQTEKSRKIFRKLGVKDLPELIEKSGGLVPALQRVNKVIKGSKDGWLALQIGSEGLNATLSLLGNQSEAFTGSLNNMRTGAEAMGEAFNKQNQTMAARMQRTKNALMAAGVSIGEVLAPALESIATHLQEAAAWFRGLDKSTQKLIITVATVTAAVGPVVTVIGKYGQAVGGLGKAFAWARESKTIAKGIGLLGKAFLALGGVLKAVGAAMLANPIILIVTAVAVSALLIWKYWEPIKAFFVRLWPSVREPFMGFLNYLKKAFFTFVPLGILVKHWGPVKQFFVDLWEGITDVFDWAWSKIEPIVSKVSAGIDKIKDAKNLITGGPEAMQFELDLDTLEPSARPRIVTPREAPRLVGGATAQTNGAPGGETKVMVEFSNAPRGTRVEQESRGASVDLAVGYQMGGL